MSGTVSFIIDNLSKDLGLNIKADEWLTSNEVCQRMKIHPNTLYRMISTGQLAAYSITVSQGGKRVYRIRESDIEAYLNHRYCGS